MQIAHFSLEVAVEGIFYVRCPIKDSLVIRIEQFSDAAIDSVFTDVA